MHLTFRGGGTSLNGQGQTDGILVDVRRHWFGVEVEDGGAPGAAEARARSWATPTACSRPHGYLLGPDPASTDIATVGGGDRQQLGRDALRRDLGLVLDGRAR